MINNKFNNMSMLRLITSWANTNLIKDVINAEYHINWWYNAVEKMIKDRGVDDTIKRVKLARLCVTRYLCDQPLRVTGDVSVAVDKKGLPRMIGPLKQLATGETSDTRLLLSLLNVSRALSGSQYFPPLNTITDEAKIDNAALAELQFLIPMVMGSMGVTGSSKPQWKKFHLTTKAGPNAVALTSAMIEARSIPEQLLKSLEVVGGKTLIDHLKEVRMYDPQGVADIYKVRGYGTKPVLLRKLSIVHSPERKSRIIAILDYWSQTALKPLHDRIFSTLKSIAGDCTFMQTNPLKTLTDGPYYSLDLTAATDRFPIEIQKIVLEQFVGDKDYVNHWASILTDYEFYCPWENRTVKYGSGQPMGAYSSWAVFALTHHVMIRVAAMKCGNPYFTNYALLGDDVVIGGAAVAGEYQKLIQSLGVSISLNKSHTSDKMFEFAKRWYRNGTEVTGMQINAFIASRNKWFLVANEYRKLATMWNIDNYETEPGTVKSLYQALVTNSYQLDRIVNKALAFLSLPWDRTDMSREEQALRFIQSVAPQILGCHQMARTRAWSFMTAGLAEVKSRVLEQGLLKVRGNAQDSIKSLRKLLKYYEGADAQSGYRAIPSLQIAFEQFNQLASDIDDLRDPMITTPEKLIFNEVRYLGFDSSRIMVTRSSEVLMATNATLVNQYRRWLREYFSLLQIVLDEKTDENECRAIARKIFRTKVIGAVMPGFPLSGGKETSG